MIAPEVEKLWDYYYPIFLSISKIDIPWEEKWKILCRYLGPESDLSPAHKVVMVYLHYTVEEIYNDSRKNLPDQVRQRRQQVRARDFKVLAALDYAKNENETLLAGAEKEYKKFLILRNKYVKDHPELGLEPLPIPVFSAQDQKTTA